MWQGISVGTCGQIRIWESMNVLQAVAEDQYSCRSFNLTSGSKKSWDKVTDENEVMQNKMQVL